MTPRVALVVTSQQTARLFVLGFARFLQEQGAQVTVFCDGADGLRSDPRTGGLELVSIPMWRDPSPLRDIGALLLLIRALRRRRPDVLVYATPKASLLAAVAGSVLGIPVRVYDLWGLRLETATGPSARLLQALERLTMLASTAVVANSSSLARRAQQLGLSRGRGVTVLGAGSSHGVDLARFRARPRDTLQLEPGTAAFLQRGGGVVVGYVGRMHPDKGIDTLLDAVRICLSHGVDVRLLLIGSQEGTDPRVQCPALFDQRRAHWVDHVDDPSPYYAAMDILALPSRREGFPNVVLEAAATGVPAIVSDATGVVDSAVHEDTGLITPVDDADALAAAIQRLVVDDDLRARLGRRARRRVEQEFSQRGVWQLRSDFLRTLIS